jgi:hypothetical protein
MGRRNGKSPSSKPAGLQPLERGHCPGRKPAFFGCLSAPRAHAKAPYKTDLQRETRVALKRPKAARTGGGEARAEGLDRGVRRGLARGVGRRGLFYEGALLFGTTIWSSYRDSPYKRELR